MPWEFTEHHVRPNVFYWSPKAREERKELKGRQREAVACYKHAKTLAERGEYDAAEEQLEVAIAAWPDNPKFVLALAGVICNFKEDPERSLRWYDRAVEIKDCHEHRIARAAATAYMGCLEEALEDMQAALENQRMNGVYVRTRGILNERMGRYKEAILEYRAAIPMLKELHLPIVDTVINQGYCSRMLCKHEEALRLFDEAQRLAPSNVTVRVLLGCTYVDRKRYREAQSMFSAQVAARPNSPAAHNNMGLAMFLGVTAAAAAAAGKAAALAKSSNLAQTASMQLAHSMRVRSPSPLNGGGGGDDEDDDEVELSDEDEEFDMVAAGAGFSSRAASNEDPKQWLLSILQADSGSVSKEHPNSEERVEVLRKALEHFNTAAELLEVAAKDAPAWPSGVSVSKDGVHAMEPNAPGKVDSGILLMLVFSQRVPGFPAVHDMEMQEGEVEYNRGQVHLALGNLNQAEEDFSTAIAINPTHAHYPHFRAVVFARKGEYNKAISWNLQALALNDGYFPATYHLGMVLHLVGRNAEALERINIALKRNPQAWAVLEACGRILQELDRHTPAVQALQDALRNLDPEEPMAVTARLHYAIAQSAISSHDVPLLRESLSQARMHGQDAASIYNLRGLLTRREKQLPKAAAYLSRAVALAPDEARFLFDRSQVHMERRRMDAAIADLTSALRLLPNNASLLYYRGTAYYLRALGSDDDISALADFEAAAHVFTDGHMWRRAPVMTEKSGSGAGGEGRGGGVGGGGGGGLGRALRVDARLWEGSKIITGSPTPPDLTTSLWYHLGCVHARLGSFSQACDAMEAAAALLPTHPMIMHELAKCYQATGRFSDAVDRFNRVLEQQPRNARAIFRRGLALKSLKRYDEAAEDMEAARKLEPGNAALWVDYHRLSDIDVIELCKPGQESTVMALELAR